MDDYETYERNGLHIRIVADNDPESPREWDNIGTMICSHRRYTLGDEQFDPDEYDDWNALKQHLIKNLDAAVVLPLGLYDHSGITMYVGDSHDRWDGGQVGFIYMTNEVFKDNFDYADQEEATKQAIECLKGEVETYDQYLTGDVWGFIIENPKDDEEIDSCWGFYGLEYCKQEANDVADRYVHPHDAAYAKKAGELHG